MVRDRTSPKKQRRNFLKKIGVGVTGITALSGCLQDGGDNAGEGNDSQQNTSEPSGQGGGDNAGEGNDSQQNTSEPSGAVTENQSQTDFSDVEIEHWNLRHQESEAADQAIKQAVSEYEDETGATINVNYSTFDAASGTKWINNMKRGNRPVFADTPAGNLGLMITEGMARPYSEYKQHLSEDVVGALDWYQSKASDLFFSHPFYGGGTETYVTPISASPGNCFLARRDHFEEAGLDIESDFPPTNHEELKELAVTLTEDGPADYGFHVYGGLGDITDAGPSTLASALGGWDGAFVKQDWSDTIIDNEVWKTVFNRWNSFYQDLGTSGPSTVTDSEEDATILIANGEVSMSLVPGQNHSMLVNQAQSQLEDGLLKWAPPWQGESGVRTPLFGKSIMFISKPDDVDEGTWEKKTKVAADFVSKKILSKDFQKNTYRSIGNYTVRDDISADDVIEAQEDPDLVREHNLIESMETSIYDQETLVGSPNFPQASQITYDIMAPEVQEALRGDKSVEEALNTAAETAREQIDFEEWSEKGQ